MTRPETIACAIFLKDPDGDQQTEAELAEEEDVGYAASVILTIVGD